MFQSSISLDEAAEYSSNGLWVYLPHNIKFDQLKGIHECFTCATPLAKAKGFCSYPHLARR